MDDPLPSELVSKFSPGQLAEAKSWWQALSPSSQTEIIVLLDSRTDGRGYVYSVDESGKRQWQSIPIEKEPQCEHEHDDEEFWVNELIHYRLDHEEFVMTSDLENCSLRVFGVCSNHVSAQEAIAERKICKKFRCSNNDANCPIKKFVNQFDYGVMLDHNPESDQSLWLTK